VLPVITGGTETKTEITQKIPEQHTRKVQHNGTTENIHIGHHTQTSGSTTVKNINDEKQHYTHHICKHRTAATLYNTLKSGFVAGI
jgi:hypothetical protein